MEKNIMNYYKQSSMATITGFVMFKCSQCGTRFFGPDKEENGAIFREPCECPQCGHVEKKPFNFLDLVRERKKNALLK